MIPSRAGPSGGLASGPVRAFAEGARGGPDTVRLVEVRVPARSRADFRSLDPAGLERAERALAAARKPLVQHAVWHVNTSRADAVSESLRSLLGYARDGGINARWLIAEIEHDHRVLARRLYNRLYGSPGDGGPLGDEERELMEAAGGRLAADLAPRLREGDVVFLHDPPMACLIEPALAAGARVAWRCHLGMNVPNEHARRAQAFLLPLVGPAHAHVFSRREYAWAQLDPATVAVLRPSLDPFSPKNEHLGAEVTLAILDRIGLTDFGVRVPPRFTRFDGSPSRVDRAAAIDQDGPVVAGAPVVAQVSGWEKVKDQLGLMEAFAGSCPSRQAHLVLAGASTARRSPGSEERWVLGELRERRRALPERERARIHIVELPLADRDENAVIVNAIQRDADVVVHKSLQEAFGLSVTEAMWKSKAVLGSRVGGIAEQIVDDESGLLLDDPADLDAAGRALGRLLADPMLRERLGTAAHQRVGERFLTSGHLADYLELVVRVGRG